MFLELESATAFNTNWEFLISLRDSGRLAAKEWLKDNYHHIGKKSSVNIQKEFFADADSIMEV